MALQCLLSCRFSTSVLMEERKFQASISMSSSGPSGLRSKIWEMYGGISKVMSISITKSKASEVAAEVVFDRAKPEKENLHKDGRDGDDSEASHDSSAKTKRESKNFSKDEDEPILMSDEERWEFRNKIREVMDMSPDVEEEVDPVERQKKVEKLLADYPLVVDEEDPDWPEDADGWGFNLGQFFNKISIKNVKKEDDDNYDSDKELVWQDDDYIRAVKDITTKEWEETAFKDISPLIILVHNRYKRPKENEKVREEIERGVQIFWDSRLPSPRCVAVDAIVETDLASALKVSVFPELIFTKAGKILYRERARRSADELSKMMAFFYYGAKQPSWFVYNAKSSQELIPSLT